MDTIDYYDIAKEILVEIGAIAFCDAHDDFYYACDIMKDETIIIKEACKKFESKHGNYDIEEFKSAAKTVYDQASLTSDCPYCYKTMND